MAHALVHDDYTNHLADNSKPDEIDIGLTKEWKSLQKKALYHYDKSLSAKTRSEQTVVHRGYAKEFANKLRRIDRTRVVALNLLARIALDEGFYQLAEHHLNDALGFKGDDVGCWYSLGHVKLAQKKYDNALQCFTRALDIAPKETRAATSIAYTLAKKGRIVEAFLAYRNLFKIHPEDQHIQAKLFEILPLIQADYFQLDLETDVVKWLKMNKVNHQAMAKLVMSLLKHKYKIHDPNAIIDLQDLAKDKLLTLSLGKIYFTDSSLETFIALIRKQVLLNSIATEYEDKALLKLATNLAMHAEHNEHVYAYDNDEKSIVNAIQSVLEDVVQRTPTDLSQFAHLIVLYSMYESPYQVEGFCDCALQLSNTWPHYIQPFIQHAIVDVQQEVVLSKQIPQLGTITNQVSLNVKEQYEENPYPRWLHFGFNTPTNYGRALERELVGFRAPEFFNMGTVKVLIAGAGTGRHALTVAQYFRNVEVLAVDLSKRSLAYAQRKANELGIQNIRFLCGDILELDQLDEQFHVIECSGVLHHMQNPEQGLAMLKKKLVNKGLLKIGLYSFQARQIVRKMREVIQQYDLPIQASGIRTLRQAILEEKMPYDFSGILSSQDFYSLSGCRDLLFHVQEVQYEPKELQELIVKENLNFLGFVLSETVRHDYIKQFPDDSKLTNLENWQVYEQNKPTTFAGMFQFFVQK